MSEQAPTGIAQMEQAANASIKANQAAALEQAAATALEQSKASQEQVDAQAAHDQEVQAAQVKAQTVENRHASGETAALNDAAELAIYGSRGRTYVDPKSGNIIASPEKPIKGKIDVILEQGLKGISGHEDGKHLTPAQEAKNAAQKRQVKAEANKAEADKYIADVQGLISEGYELSQAKLIMDKRAERQVDAAKRANEYHANTETRAKLVTKLEKAAIAGGMDSAEARAKALLRVTKQAQKEEAAKKIPTEAEADAELKSIVRSEGVFSANDYDKIVGNHNHSEAKIKIKKVDEANYTSQQPDAKPEPKPVSDSEIEPEEPVDPEVVDEAPETHVVDTNDGTNAEAEAVEAEVIEDEPMPAIPGWGQWEQPVPEWTPQTEAPIYEPNPVGEDEPEALPDAEPEVSPESDPDQDPDPEDEQSTVEQEPADAEEVNGEEPEQVSNSANEENKKLSKEARKKRRRAFIKQVGKDTVRMWLNSYTDVSPAALNQRAAVLTNHVNYKSSKGYNGTEKPLYLSDAVEEPITRSAETAANESAEKLSRQERVAKAAKNMRTLDQKFKNGFDLVLDKRDEKVYAPLSKARKAAFSKLRNRKVTNSGNAEMSQEDERAREQADYDMRWDHFDKWTNDQLYNYLDDNRTESLNVEAELESKELSAQDRHEREIRLAELQRNYGVAADVLNTPIAEDALSS